MSDLYKYIGNKIRDLRQKYAAEGISQEDLAREIKTTANTISRWETAAYKPSAMDLHNLAKFFSVNISVFFPAMEVPSLQALMSALGELDESDIDELTHYAQYRKAKQLLDAAKKNKK
ncbi:MAG: helix-turn-helix domain-containing protein [Pyrinomonadaceae bacterium]